MNKLFSPHAVTKVAKPGLSIALGDVTNIDDSLGWCDINLPTKPIQAYQPILSLRPCRKRLGQTTCKSIDNKAEEIRLSRIGAA